MYNYEIQWNKITVTRTIDWFGGISLIKVGIIGSTGYVGQELVRLLQMHKEVEIVWYGSKNHIEKEYAQIFQNMFRIVEATCLDDDMETLSKQADVIFTATPQGFCASKCTDSILANAKLIDLSADYRIKDTKTYEAWYGIKHQSPQYIKEAVYGLCELNREQIKHARLVANPGCYPTCSILSLYPLLKEGIIQSEGIIIDAKSGVSGAGRGAKVNNLYCEVNETIKAYQVATHRHTPEIEEQLSIAAGKKIIVQFTPHLVPMDRGILTSAYAKLAFPVEYEKVREIYHAYYETEPFIRILNQGVCPETRWVRGSNYVDINVAIDKRTNQIIVMGAMDNIVKGAAGQAIQNMNLMFGLEETKGLQFVPMVP